MMERDQAVNALRSTIPFEPVQSNPNQLFQDCTLRPILKFQHELILAIYVEFVNVHKLDLINCNTDERNLKIEQSIKMQQPLQSVLKGIVIALFNKAEIDYWLINKSDINKRILQLLIKRIQSEIKVKF